MGGEKPTFEIVSGAQESHFVRNVDRSLVTIAQTVTEKTADILVRIQI